jgi:hypothetical protein
MEWWTSGRLTTWLTVSLATFPALVASTALAAYLLGSLGDKPLAGSDSLMLGLRAGILLALILGGLSLIFLTPEKANPYEYRALTNRCCALAIELQRFAGDPKAQEAIACAPDPATMFADRGLRWVAGHGYLSLWTQVHQAEEALFMVEPVEWLIAEANRDLLRLTGSKMPQASDFLTDIAAAVKALSPRAAQPYLSSSLASDPLAGDPAKWEQLARLKLRDVRTGLNAYRQSLWDGLVRARNQFVRTLILTTVVTAIVIAVVVGRGTSPRMVLVATILYLIGVLLGLFARLQGLISSTSVEEDFGLDTAHLLAAPILSGVAAVVGVLLVALLKLKIGDINIGPPTVAANESLIRATLNLGTYPGALIVAGLFGITPELLIRYLKTQAESLSKGLSATETWGKASPPSGGGKKPPPP